MAEHTPIMPAGTRAANDDTLDLQGAAAYLHIGFKAMKALVDTGEVAALSCNQKHCVMLKEDLREYVRNKGRSQQAARQRKQTVAVNQWAAEQPLRKAKKAMPDLRNYELTTGARKG